MSKNRRKRKEKKKQQLQRNKETKKEEEEDLRWSCAEEGRKRKERKRKERKDGSGVGEKVGGTWEKKEKFFFGVLHIAAFFEKHSYRSLLKKNYLARPIAAFQKCSYRSHLKKFIRLDL